MKFILHSIFFITILTSCQGDEAQVILALKNENTTLSENLNTEKKELERANSELVILREEERKKNSLMKKIELYIRSKDSGDLERAKAIKIEIFEQNLDQNINKLLSFINDAGAEDLKKGNAEINKDKPTVPANARDNIDIKNLKIVSKCVVGDVEIFDIKNAATKKWIFDRNNYEYHYREADKGSLFLTIDFTAKSKNKNPILPVFVAAVMDSANKLKVIGVSEIQFPSWTNYGAYLGNYHDFKNDFAKRDAVKFTSAIQISESDYKSKKLLVFMPNINCSSRYEDSSSPPPVSYGKHQCEEKIKEMENELQIVNLIKAYN